jgi:uncharacterized membrane protein HdeD (DUF308 family)
MSTSGEPYRSPPADALGLLRPLLIGAFLADLENSRRWTVLMSGTLILVLALVVLYTNRGRLSSPVSIVVLAAVGLLALILQLRLRGRAESRGIASSPWLNIVGVGCALAALGLDIWTRHADYAAAFALLAVGCFAVSSAILLQGFRKAG